MARKRAFAPTGETLIVGKEVYKGRTKTLANAKALEHLAMFMDGEGFNPIAVRAGTHIGIVFRDANGFWSYRINRPEGSGSVCSGAWKARAAERIMRRHLAQDVYEQLGDASLDVIEHEEDRKDHARWIAWQKSYTRLRAEGKDDNEARNALMGM